MVGGASLSEGSQEIGLRCDIALRSMLAVDATALSVGVGACADAGAVVPIDRSLRRPRLNRACIPLARLVRRDQPALWAGDAVFPLGAEGIAGVVGGVMGWEDVIVLRRATSPVLIGRTGERARLDAAFRSACDGAPVIVLVAGEAGIGKTRLVTEFAADVRREARVLAGACIDERVPYSPVADALRNLVRSGWDPGDVGERGWADLGALVPDLAGPLAAAGQARTAHRGGYRAHFSCWWRIWPETARSW